MAKKGKFIVFEGIDGAGSTTQLDKLFSYFKKNKIPALRTAEPTNNSIGKLIRDVLNKKQKLTPKAFQLLYCADRQEHLDSEIIPALKAGKAVLCDRYYYSTIAYGSLAAEKKWLLEKTKDFLKPDITLFINTSVNVAMNRMRSRSKRELFEKKRLLEKVSRVYLDLMKKHKECIVINGDRSKDEIFDDVLKVIKKKII